MDNYFNFFPWEGFRGTSSLKGLYRQAVTVEAEAADDTTTSTANHGVMAELFALMHIRDMHLDDRSRYGTDAVMKCHTCVRIGTGIEHDAVVIKSYLLHLIDELSFDITLEIIDLYVRITLTQQWQICLE